MGSYRLLTEGIIAVPRLYNCHQGYYSKRSTINKQKVAYCRLRLLQEYQIPVCVGQFTPRITCWYHGKLMARMMILSWAGARVQNFINMTMLSSTLNEGDLRKHSDRMESSTAMMNGATYFGTKVEAVQS